MSYLITSYNNFALLAHKVEGNQDINDFSIITSNSITKLNLKSINPAFVLRNPDDNTIFYVCHESIYDGFISTLSYKNGEFKILKTVSSMGKSSCYLAFTPNKSHVINVNYWDSSMSLHPIINGVLLDACYGYNNSKKNNITHIEDHLKDRQSTSHHHSCFFYKNKIYVPDLGLNVIDIFCYDYNRITYISKIELDKGDGPRYGILNENIVYIVNEISSSVSVINLDTSSIIQKISVIKNKNAVNTCSGIKMSSKGYLYVSNRGHNTITVLKIGKDKLLSYLKEYDTMGEIPRHFIINNCENELLVANQNSDNISVFKIDDDKLEFKNIFKCNKPNFIVDLS
jgi:6-phosphogluconolactonase